MHDVGALVFDVGDRITGWGPILQVASSVFFDPPRTAGIAELRSHRQRKSRWAIKLLHADASIVGGDTSGGDTRPGWGTVTGIWLGDAIDVLSQSTHRISPSPQSVTPPSSPVPVTRSRWTPTQLDETSNHLTEHWDEWTISSVIGGGLDDRGRPGLEVHVFRVLPSMSRWATTLSDGLIHVVATLTPDR